MDLIRELSNLERRVSFEQLVNIEQLSTRDMDINEFILCNFVVQNGPAFEMNYAKIASTLPQLQQIQQRTCEDIALSVDLNLDQYVQISEKLQGLRDTLSHLQDRYSSVENDIEITKEALQEKIYQINAILENLKLINKLDSNMNVLKQLLKKMHQLNDSLPQIT
jgi:chromosome segregation ATPase